MFVDGCMRDVRGRYNMIVIAVTAYLRVSNIIMPVPLLSVVCFSC